MEQRRQVRIRSRAAQRHTVAGDVLGGLPPATQPCWTARYMVAGEPRERAYHASREAEARSMLARDEPTAYDIELSFSETTL